MESDDSNAGTGRHASATHEKAEEPNPAEDDDDSIGDNPGSAPASGPLLADALGGHAAPHPHTDSHEPKPREGAGESQRPDDGRRERSHSQAGSRWANAESSAAH